MVFMHGQQDWGRATWACKKEQMQHIVKEKEIHQIAMEEDEKFDFYSFPFPKVLSMYRNIEN